MTRAKCHNQKNDRVRPWEGVRELSESWSGTTMMENEMSLLAKFTSFLILFYAGDGDSAKILLNHKAERFKLEI